ncbi:MAG: spkB, partial [Pseudonocardiales bacterium]|nr:spkB [Pseudonocardiales bacterium]
MMSARPADLVADCAQCFGLCCVALPFAASADFAFDKRGGEPCRNLDTDYGCGIHARLRESGMQGCTSFDCLGAGQRVSQVTFGARSWRESPTVKAQMFAVFPIMRVLHEVLAYLGDALSRPAPPPVRDDVLALQREVEAMTRLGPDELQSVHVNALRARVGPSLAHVSAAVRSASAPRAASLRGADLIGADRRGADLRGADLRSAYLIGADLRAADLREADLIGADLRDADLRGANLTGALFVVQPQINAARGDA